MSKTRFLDLGDLTTQITKPDPDTIILNSVQTLDPYPKTIIDRLIHWAEETPDAIFIAQRDPKDRNRWRQYSYKATLDAIQHLASGLSNLSLSEEKPIAILSGNSIEHALLGLAAMYVGVPFAPISPQYSLTSTDYSKLKHVITLITPGLIFVEDAVPYAKAVKACAPSEVKILSCTGIIEGYDSLQFSELIRSPINVSLKDTYAAVKPDTVAKFLFSSGSTGMPKAVINTHRMIAANQQMILQSYPFLGDKPVLVDWLPWNHTFGGNHNLGITLYNGGSYYIDEGKPTPAAFAETIRNLEEISPSVYFNVPKGFELLVKSLKTNKNLREHFYPNLKMMFYAGAGISQPVWDALDQLAIENCGERIKILTGLGCTETAPSALFTSHQKGFAGLIGLPLPGLEAKLKFIQGKYEIRFRGDNVTPGYWREPALTAKAFDEEGFYKTGDAVKFVDENDPQQGLQFDGRISEDFKLNTGTWVSAGPLRALFLDHFGPLVKDVVIIGRDKPSVGALVFPDIDYCKTLVSESERDLSDEALLALPQIQEYFQGLLKSFAQQATGSSNRINCLILQHDLPSMDKHEITDKGSLNAGAIQDNRKDQIELMYRSEPGSQSGDNTPSDKVIRC